MKSTKKQKKVPETDVVAVELGVAGDGTVVVTLLRPIVEQPSFRRLQQAFAVGLLGFLDELELNALPGLCRKAANAQRSGDLPPRRTILNVRHSGEGDGDYFEFFDGGGDNCMDRLLDPMTTVDLGAYHPGACAALASLYPAVVAGARNWGPPVARLTVTVCGDQKWHLESGPGVDLRQLASPCVQLFFKFMPHAVVVVTTDPSSVSRLADRLDHTTMNDNGEVDQLVVFVVLIATETREVEILCGGGCAGLAVAGPSVCAVSAGRCSALCRFVVSSPVVRSLSLDGVHSMQSFQFIPFVGEKEESGDFPPVEETSNNLGGTPHGLPPVEKGFHDLPDTLRTFHLKASASLDGRIRVGESGALDNLLVVQCRSLQGFQGLPEKMLWVEIADCAAIEGPVALHDVERLRLGGGVGGVSVEVNHVGEVDITGARGRNPNYVGVTGPIVPESVRLSGGVDQPQDMLWVAGTRGWIKECVLTRCHLRDNDFGFLGCVKGKLQIEDCRGKIVVPGGVERLVVVGSGALVSLERHSLSFESVSFTDVCQDQLVISPGGKIKADRVALYLRSFRELLLWLGTFNGASTTYLSLGTVAFRNVWQLRGPVDLATTFPLLSDLEVCRILCPRGVGFIVGSAVRKLTLRGVDAATCSGWVYRAIETGLRELHAFADGRDVAMDVRHSVQVAFETLGVRCIFDVSGFRRFKI